MCVYSMVVDAGKRYWDQQKNILPVPQLPIKDLNREAEIIRKLDELLKKAAEWDKVSEQPDCEDPAKAIWANKLVKRLDAIEKRLKELEG